MAWRFALIATLLTLGALNREMTGILIWLSVFAATPRQWRFWLFLGALLGAILIGLRLFVPAIEGASIADVWHSNLYTWQRDGALLYNLLLLPLWILLYHRMRGTMRYRVAVILIPYLALWTLLAVWQEVRLLMPVLILGIPFTQKVFGYDT